MSQVYENEDDIPTADYDESSDSTDSRYLSWIKYSFIGYVLLGGVAGAAGVSALYIAVAPLLLGLTFCVLVALDARQISDWGVSKYLWAFASLVPPLVLVYYFRRGMKTV